MKDKVKKIREEVARLRNLHQIKYQNLDTNDNMCLVECGKRNLCNELLSFIDSMQEEPVSKVWHDPDEEPEVERTIIWEDEKMMGKHLFQGQWRPKIDVFGRKERWCYLSDILNL